MEIQTENLSAESTTELKTEAKKPVQDYPVLKVQLPREAALKVQSALQVLRERKADTKIDELLAEYLEAVTEDYFEIQIEKRTPEDYYFEAAKNIPELREKVILQAKKALQQRPEKVLAGGTPSSEVKKPRKKEKPSETFMVAESPEVTQ